MEDTEMAKKQKGRFVRIIRNNMKEYYRREVSFTLPTSILELLPTKIND